MIDRRWWTGLAVLALASIELKTASGGERVVSPAEARFKTDVSFLADDAREGRAPGTAGIESAAAYIAGVFREAGLTPAKGAEGYFQPFSIFGPAKLVDGAELELRGPDEKVIAPSRELFSPLAIGIGGTIENAPIVFAGYGITAKDPSKNLDYDDYAGLDVKDKAVLIIRREPRQNRDDSPFDGKKDSAFALFTHKATNAFQHGAAAVLLVNDLAGLKDGKDDLIGFRMAGPDPTSRIPFVAITRALADRLLADAGRPSLADLEAAIDEDLAPHSQELKGWTLRTKIEIERPKIETRNVVGVLEGYGPLASETVVVGAHYDHLGRGGGAGSGSLAPGSKDIHNGADDNASGTAMVLEMVRRLTRRADPLPRRIVFVAFSGEERGLLGSQHYVTHPLLPLDDTVMMVNFDMVGRLNDHDELTVYGTGTSTGMDALVDALGKSEGFTVKKIADGFGPSDQQSFYVKNIPVLFAFTGNHSDYHRPSDDTERINFQGMSRIADLAELLLLDVARRPVRPAFVKVVSKGSLDPGRVSISAYLGSIPDYNEDIQGVKLNGVREGSPAEKGGLRGGDVIIKFGGKPIGTIYDYTEGLSRYKPGDLVDVVVLRDGKETTLKITLGRKPVD